MSKTNQAPPPTLAGAFGRLGARLLPEQALRGTTTTSAGNAGTALSNEGMEYVPGTPSGLKGHPLPIRWKSDVNKPSGGELNIEKQPPRRPLRDADPLPTTLAEAYESLGPRAVGNTTLGRLIGTGHVIGTPNNSGFIELTPEMQQEIAGVWSDDMMSPTNVVQYDKSIFEESPVAFSASEVPVSFDYGDLKLTSGINDHVMPGLTPKTGLQALRADERSKGLIYASGKYWAENADGKLEAIPSDLINGEGTARQQAIAFMESRKQPIIEAVQKNSKVNESVMTPTSELPSPQLKGFTGVSGTRPDGTAKTAQEIDNEIELRQQALEEQSIIEAPTQTTPFGGISEGFQSTQLPGNTKMGLVTAGEFTGLSTHRENIDKNGFPKYGSGQRFWTVPSDNPNAVW